MSATALLLQTLLLSRTATPTAGILLDSSRQDKPSIVREISCVGGRPSVESEIRK